MTLAGLVAVMLFAVIAIIAELRISNAWLKKGPGKTRLDK